MVPGPHCEAINAGFYSKGMEWAVLSPAALPFGHPPASQRGAATSARRPAEKPEVPGTTLNRWGPRDESFHSVDRKGKRKGRRPWRAASFIACLVATATFSGFMYVCNAGASGPSVAPLALQELKLVDYFPAGASWTNMWTDFQPAQVQADFATIKALGANAVRLTIDPYTVGWPTVSPIMAASSSRSCSLLKMMAFTSS